ncbi:hypothetical protein O0L34_g14913 [Tuta absoluta]|nr:hypothetical protein O0L34_g14913 [Tuta absoluta]
MDRKSLRIARTEDDNYMFSEDLSQVFCIDSNGDYYLVKVSQLPQDLSEDIQASIQAAVQAGTVKDVVHHDTLSDQRSKDQQTTTKVKAKPKQMKLESTNAQISNRSKTPISEKQRKHLEENFGDSMSYMNSEIETNIHAESTTKVTPHPTHAKEKTKKPVSPYFQKSNTSKTLTGQIPRRLQLNAQDNFNIDLRTPGVRELPADNNPGSVTGQSRRRILVELQPNISRTPPATRGGSIDPRTPRVRELPADNNPGSVTGQPRRPILVELQPTNISRTPPATRGSIDPRTPLVDQDPSDSLTTGNRDIDDSWTFAANEDSETIEDRDETRAHWSRAQILELIESFKTHRHIFQSTTTRNSEAWRLISEDLQTHTAKQCESKFKYLKKCYIKKKDNISSRSSGASALTFEFFEEFDELFREEPNIVPSALAANLEMMPPQSSEASDNIPTASEDSRRPKRRRTRLEVQLDRFQRNMELREQARERRFSMLMERHAEFTTGVCAMLQKLIDKM